MNIGVSNERGDIIINYDLIDYDGDSCTVELYYSLDGGTVFTHSINHSLYGVRVFAATGLFLTWNSDLDFQSEEKNVKIRLVPDDSRGGGAPGESSVFYVNNIKNTPPVIQNLSVSGDYKDILIHYDLIELDGHLCTIETAFSLDGGLSYFDTPYLTGETAGVAAGPNKTLIWHSYSDFAVCSENVVIKVTPSDKYGYGTEAVFGPFAVYNGGKRPEISGLTVSGGAKIIELAYELKDIDSSPCTVEVYYSLDGGASFTYSGYTQGDIHAVVPGAGKIIKWDSYGDFRTREENVVIKLLPIDDAGAGKEAISPVFTVDNNLHRPTIANLSTKVDSGEVRITYDLDDLDSSACRIEFQYATEVSGGYLNSNFIIGETDGVLPGAGKTLLWRSKNDFTQNYDSVSVKLIVYDDGGYGGEAVSSPFKVYNNAVSEIKINSVSGGSRNITVSFNVTDLEGDTCDIEVFYSRDNGASFIKTANITGAASNILPADNLQLMWQSEKDIVNQNASGVVLKLAVIGPNGDIQNFDVSSPFTVNNYIPPPPPPPPPLPPPVASATLDKVEMLSKKKIKLTFSENIVVSDQSVTLSKISLNRGSFSFDSGDRLECSRNTITITVDLSNNPGRLLGDILPTAQQDGIIVDDENSGFILSENNGIKTESGAEIPASTAGHNVQKDTTAPDELDSYALESLYVSLTKKYVLSHNQITLSESCRLQVCIEGRPGGPDNESIYEFESEEEMESIEGDFNLAIPEDYEVSDLEGKYVYYRLVDPAGNKTAWKQDGVLPSRLNTDIVIYWSNSMLTAFIDKTASGLNFGTINVGEPGQRLKVYQKDSNSDTFTYKAQAQDSAPDGGYEEFPAIDDKFLPEKYCGLPAVKFAGYPSGNPIDDNGVVCYVLENSDGNESAPLEGGTVPPPPQFDSGIDKLVTTVVENKYALKNIGSNDFGYPSSSEICDIFIGTERLYCGEFSVIEPFDPQKSPSVYSMQLSGDGLKDGGPLVITAINSDGNSSNYTVISSDIPKAPVIKDESDNFTVTLNNSSAAPGLLTITAPITDVTNNTIIRLYWKEGIGDVDYKYAFSEPGNYSVAPSQPVQLYISPSTPLGEIEEANCQLYYTITVEGSDNESCPVEGEIINQQ